jgi:Rad3-related DNA helicase
MDRGVDLKDDQCRSIILLKFPYPSLGDTFLKTLRKQVGEEKFWNYYQDIANRDLLQQCGRAIRNNNDWCQIYSPDYKVIKELKNIWRGTIKEQNY